MPQNPQVFELASSFSARQLLFKLAFEDKKQKYAIAALIFALLIVAVFEPMIPSLLKYVIDHGFNSQNSFPLWWVPAVLIPLVLLRCFAAWNASYISAWITQKMLATLRSALYRKINYTSLDLLNKESSASLVAAIIYDPQASLNQVIMSLVVFVRDGCTLLVLYAYLFYLNWQLTSVTFLVVAPIFFVVKLIAARLQRRANQQIQSGEQLGYWVEESWITATVLRVFNAQQTFIQRFETLSEKLRKITMKYVVILASLNPLAIFITSFALVIVLIFALWQGRQDNISAGSFVAFITAMLMTFPPLRHIAEAFQPIVRAIASLTRALEILKLKNETNHGTHQARLCSGDLQFHQISLFATDEARGQILYNIDLQIKPGESVALVGPSGAGKTSLVKLIPRLILPSSGKITLDGVDLDEWELHNLRSHIAYVAQDATLLNDSVAMNICFGLSIDHTRLARAIEAAALEPFIASLPQNVNTVVGHNGTALSGGQRQRVAIARAIYKDASFLILDEATSALDAEAENAVQVALASLMKNRTSIVIAHRLSTIVSCNRIFVMQQGSIVDIGNHNELLAKQGLYKELYQLQIQKMTE